MINKIYQWILNRQFVKDALLQAEIKAFPKAQKDVLETMRDDLEAQAEQLANLKLATLLTGMSLNSIVTVDKAKGALFIGGERADAMHLANLKSEAEFLVNSELWQLLSDTPRRLAEKAMFTDDGTLENLLIKGRAILFTLDTQRNILDILQSFTQK